VRLTVSSKDVPSQRQVVNTTVDFAACTTSPPNITSVTLAPSAVNVAWNASLNVTAPNLLAQNITYTWSVWLQADPADFETRDDVVLPKLPVPSKSNVFKFKAGSSTGQLPPGTYYVLLQAANPQGQVTTVKSNTFTVATSPTPPAFSLSKISVPALTSCGKSVNLTTIGTMPSDSRFDWTIIGDVDAAPLQMTTTTPQLVLTTGGGMDLPKGWTYYMEVSVTSYGRTLTLERTFTVTNCPPYQAAITFASVDSTGVACGEVALTDSTVDPEGDSITRTW
jgi:predicted phage tail protein